MNIQQNISLKNFNTFGINVLAKKYVAIQKIDDLTNLLKKEKDIFLLSGGSNMLLTKDIEKLVVHLQIKGKKIIYEDDDFVEIAVYAGEIWHDFVLNCVHQNYGGLENLALIPGNVGTCPIQNIGAYGVEVKDTIVSVEAIEITTQKIKVFKNVECEFGYRNSVFKNELKDKYIISKVIFKLTKKNHQLTTSYGAIEEEMAKNNIQNPTIKDVANAVINIRNSKLPNPKEIGNSGSFFKNPVIKNSHYQSLKKLFVDIPNYPVNDDEVKIPAGWLIEKVGFKGKRFGDAGVHVKQALVLVNYGNAKGSDILELAEKVKKAVNEQFSIHLETEVNIY